MKSMKSRTGQRPDGKPGHPYGGVLDIVLREQWALLRDLKQ